MGTAADVGLTGQAAFAESAAVTQHFLRGDPGVRPVGYIDTTELRVDGTHEIVWDLRGDDVGRIRFQLIEVEHQRVAIDTDGTPATSVIDRAVRPGPRRPRPRRGLGGWA